MGSESVHTEIVVGDDPRFLGALGNIVSHFAERAGLDAPARQQLADAAVEACRSAFPLLNGQDLCLRLVIQDFTDRIEVTLEHPGEPLPVAGLDSLVAGLRKNEPSGSVASILKQVDRILYETRNGCSRLTLVKYLGNSAAEKKAEIR